MAPGIGSTSLRTVTGARHFSDVLGHSFQVGNVLTASREMFTWHRLRVRAWCWTGDVNVTGETL